MIIKPRSIPDSVLKLEALLRRLPINHPRSTIEAEYSKKMAGYRGEQSIDYYLQALNPQFNILHNVRLQVQNQYVQMDTIIISHNFKLILEIKNIAGTLQFDSIFNQLIRTQNNVEEGFHDPLLQISRQKSLLSDWLTRSHVTDIPIIGVVVISNPSTIIKSSTNSELKHYIIHSAYLPHYIKELEQKHSIAKLNKNGLKKLSKALLLSHIEHDYKPLEKFNVKHADIMTGVHCPSCLTLPIRRIGQAWVCHQCENKSKSAFLDTLEDYFLLFDSTISNKEFRRFLHIEQRNTALNLMKRAGLKKIGKNRGSLYRKE